MNYLEDVEKAINRDKPNSNYSRLIDELAILISEEEQVREKGKFIGHFESSRRNLYIVLILLGALCLVLCLYFKDYIVVFGISFIVSGLIIINFYNKKLHTYIDIYENSIVGKVKSNQCKDIIFIEKGMMYFKVITVINKILYLVTYDEKEVYHLRYFRKADIVAYLINKCMNNSANGYK